MAGLSGPSRYIQKAGSLRPGQTLDTIGLSRFDSDTGRLGLFAAVCSIPMACRAACDLYEFANREAWLVNPRLKEPGHRAGNPLFSRGEITLATGYELTGSALTLHLLQLISSISPDLESYPTLGYSSASAAPKPEVFLLQIFMCLAIGLTSAVWICLVKGINTWHQFCRQRCPRLSGALGCLPVAKRLACCTCGLETGTGLQTSAKARKHVTLLTGPAALSPFKTPVEAGRVAGPPHNYAVYQQLAPGQAFGPSHSLSTGPGFEPSVMRLAAASTPGNAGHICTNGGSNLKKTANLCQSNTSASPNDSSGGYYSNTRLLASPKGQTAGLASLGSKSLTNSSSMSPFLTATTLATTGFMGLEAIPSQTGPPGNGCLVASCPRPTEALETQTFQGSVGPMTWWPGGEVAYSPDADRQNALAMDQTRDLI
ncbi:unnamed protein product [Protopolystoma xenopodis]|uniref:Frizzled/Smoothened 7TM domain-containing protein n=1 Tax=Protopolystoma xenopodis TaxID=117903 RepID=A0A448W9Z0_9PLAT|nr:unnamed protein product [Protopolystoma xenopodis]